MIQLLTDSAGGMHLTVIIERDESGYGNSVSTLRLRAEPEIVYGILSAISYDELMRQIVPVGTNHPHTYDQFLELLQRASLKETVILFDCASMTQIINRG